MSDLMLRVGDTMIVLSIFYKEDKMKITGIKSICCDDGVKTANLDRLSKEDKENDRIWVCLKCKQPCEAFYTCEI